MNDFELCNKTVSSETVCNRQNYISAQQFMSEMMLNYNNHQRSNFAFWDHGWIHVSMALMRFQR